MSSEKISIHELAKHNTTNDVWIAVNGNVYDVTSYLSDHPGGDRILVAAGGSDATEAFEDVGHSEDAEETMEGMKVGSLSGWVAADEIKHAASFVSEAIPSMDQVTSPGDSPKPWITLYGFAAISFTLALSILRPSDWPATPSIFQPLFSYKSGLVGVLGTGSICIFSVVRWLQRTLLSHPELHDFPILIDSKTERKAVETRSETALDRNKYRPLTLVEKEKVGKNAWRLRLAFPDQRSRSGLAVGQHISLRASIAGKTVVRSYTPTSRPTDAGSLDLTIKVYEDGVMGNYLQERRLGDSIHVRGPHGRFHYRRNVSKKLVCIAGGSGITPMFNVIQEICLDERDHTEVLLLYASRSEDDVMMKRELERLEMARPRKLEVEYLFSRPTNGSGMESARLSGDYLAERLSALDDDTKYLVCGPDAMVDMVREGLTGLNAEADVHIF